MLGLKGLKGTHCCWPVRPLLSLQPPLGPNPTPCCCPHTDTRGALIVDGDVDLSSAFTVLGDSSQTGSNVLTGPITLDGPTTVTGTLSALGGLKGPWLQITDGQVGGRPGLGRWAGGCGLWRRGLHWDGTLASPVWDLYTDCLPYICPPNTHSPLTRPPLLRSALLGGSRPRTLSFRGSWWSTEISGVGAGAQHATPEQRQHRSANPYMPRMPPSPPCRLGPAGARAAGASVKPAGSRYTLEVRGTSNLEGDTTISTNNGTPVITTSSNPTTGAPTTNIVSITTIVSPAGTTTPPLVVEANPGVPAAVIDEFATYVTFKAGANFNGSVPYTFNAPVVLKGATTISNPTLSGNVNINGAVKIIAPASQGEWKQSGWLAGTLGTGCLAACSPSCTVFRS